MFMATTQVLTGAAVESNDGPRRTACRLLGILMFLIVSRILDVGPDILQKLHVPFFVFLFAAGAAGFSLCLRNIASAQAPKIFALMTLWMMIGIPFAFYRKGALTTVMIDWNRTVIISLLAIGVVITFRDVAYLMNCLALGAATAALIGVFAGSLSVEGRLTIIGGGNIGNPNDLAFTVLLGLPLWIRIMYKGGILRTIAALGAISLIMVCFLKSGSRGGAAALAAITAVAFLRVSVAGKLKILGTGAALMVLAFTLLPSSLRQRYLTFFEAGVGQQEEALRVAAGSGIQRIAALTESIQMTMRNPIFGVGAGEFADAENFAAVEAGRPKGMWIGTHNTYTQLAAECGIPVLLLFLYLLGSSLRSLGQTRRRLNRDTRPLARQLRNAVISAETLLWGTAVFIFFAHRGYDQVVYLLISLGFILSRAAARELLAVPAPSAPVQAPPVPARSTTAAYVRP